ncbi:glycosyl transferase family A [Halobacteriales archaeon QH_6_64_20]|nr:MAG: glycosyl transferase family A [Halobacteriales archaeon QH_6_64_20]
MRVSVVLCTYDPALYDAFREAADSVLAQTHEDRELVIVVDGAVELAERVEADYGDRENVLVHLNDANRGLLESRNTGADLATGEVVAFIDDDAVANGEWLSELVAAYERYDTLAAGGRMVPEWVAGEPRFLPAEFLFLVGVTHRGFADGPSEVRNTFGSNISFRREIFEELGGFDPAIGGRKGDSHLQGGETELGARLRHEYGSGVQYNPDALVAHKVFAYRTNPMWLAKRAFWQGYSKRAMAVLVPESGGEEGDFLARLLGEFVPGRLRRLFERPTRERAEELAALALLTACVGFGYVYGALKYSRPASWSATEAETESEE